MASPAIKRSDIKMPKKKTDPRLRQLLKRKLDLNKVDLTDEEIHQLRGALTRGNGEIGEAELERQFIVLVKLAQDTKFNMNLFALILKGLVDVVVDHDEQLQLRASEMGLGKAPIRF